jgi:hypothetical protein
VASRHCLASLEMETGMGLREPVVEKPLSRTHRMGMQQVL